MKQQIQQLIEQSIQQLKDKQLLEQTVLAPIALERTKDKTHGDFASNIALVLAKPTGRKPRELAELIVAHLPHGECVSRVEIAGPGFINFYLTESVLFSIVNTILEEQAQFGLSQSAQGKRVLVEFVSANPTGPLHVGHGRGASYGSAIADLLAAIGYQVHREYYVNDAGRQMNILAASVWLRYLELCGEVFTFPRNGYRGEYIYVIARQLHQAMGDRLRHSAAEVFADMPLDEQDDGSGDKEAHIDALIQRAQVLLGQTHYRQVFDLALHDILEDIRKDLHEYGVDFQEWFSEQQLMDDGSVKHAVEKLTQLGFTFEQEGAIWFRSSEFGDDKDRVLLRQDGRPTYFASDVAYHVHKIERGFDKIIDVWGADHHGYVPRIKAAMRALGKGDQDFIVPLVQFATLYRGEEKVQMSTRSGEFVTLRELRDEIGKDAARFFYIMRKAEQHMDFDLELAKSASSDNPVYYIQYAHARICSVLRQAEEKGYRYDQAIGLANLALLTGSHEILLLNTLARYPEIVHTAASQLEPHVLANYLRDLAHGLHTYYNAEQFLVSEEGLRQARLSLILAVKQVLANGLQLLTVSAPEKM